jgi:hypothetical protein
MATAVNNNDDEMMPVFNGQAHESHHPDQIDPANESNNSIKHGRNVLAAMTKAIVDLDEFRVTCSPADTPATHARKVAKAVDDTQTNLTPSYTNAKAAMKADIKQIDFDLNELAGLKANPRFEAAVMARFQQMDPKDHVAAVDKMIDAGDTASLATLIDAPAVITGLDPAFRDTIRDRVLRKVAPQQLALRAALLKAIDKLDASFNRSLNDFSALKAGCDRFDAQIAAAEAVANKAKSGFAA